MNEESDSSSKNQSDQNEHIQITHANRRSVSEDLISIKSPTKQPETSLSPSIQIPSKPEPQMASRSSPIQLSSNEPSTSKIIHSISHLSSKTQKRQFEKIKQELLSESEPCDTFALSSASSKEPNQTAETSADLAEIEHKHLIESESKRQRSELVNAESIKCNLAMETEDLTTQKEPENFQYLITNSNSTLIEPIVNTCINESGDNNIKTEEEALELNENEENPIHLNDSVFCNLMKTDESKLNNTGNDPSSFPESQTTNVESENSSNSTLVDLNASLSSPSELMESETATTSKNSLNIDNSKAPKSSLNNNVKKTKFKFDPNECHDWDRIHDTDYFKERSFNFNDLMNREFGFAGRFGHGNRKSVGCNSSSILQLQSPRHLVNKAISGFNFVRRMKMTQSLNYHDGCVNALNFNRIGTLLASGSDDYQVCIWDWARSKVLLTFDSGHKSNVFQTKFMPFTRDSQIVTCARDGQVRLALISSSGSHLGTKKLAKHADSCHKLSIEYDSSNMFLSCGEDAVVYEIDLRQSTPARVLTVKNFNRNCKIPLYSISSNPFDTYQFTVAGKDPYIRVYDKRMLVDDRTKILKSFSPLHLKESQKANITSAVYNYNGTEIAASYSDDDIYLFETSQDSETDSKYRYRGHRNSETIKGVNFYGSNSDFVVSGSDCGRLFFWEKTTQQIVNVLKGDENGVVNVLEPHPNFPVMATSGLDSDIKIWAPASETPNSLDNLADIIKDNQRLRDTSRHFSLSSFEFELLLLLMHRPNNRVIIRSNDEDIIRNRLSERGATDTTNNINTSSSSGQRRRLLTSGPFRNEGERDEETDENEEEEEDDEAEEEDDDEEEDDEEEEEDDDDYDNDNESAYNPPEDNQDESNQSSLISNFFAHRHFSRERNEDSHTSEHSSSNNINRPT